MCTKCLAHTNGQILALCQRWLGSLSKGRQVEMSEGVLGIPKKAFLYGSPSRNEDHSKKKSLPYQSGTKIRKRPVITKTGVQKNKVLGLPPNSLDFKQLHKSSLVNNNLLKFRKVRQTKGTPRDLWTLSPTNQSMSELMAFSFKKEPKEKKNFMSIPTHLTVENASYWGERDDDLWKKYLKDLENYSYDLHTHNRLVEMTASNREAACETYSNLSRYKPKESMLEYLMSKMDDENLNLRDPIDKSLNREKIRETPPPENMPPNTLPTLAQFKNRPTSAPALMLPRSRFNVINFSPNSSDRSTFISPTTTTDHRNRYNRDSFSPYLSDANHVNECYDFQDLEPPMSTIIHKSTLNKRSRLTLHDRWTDHLLELFEVFESQNDTPNSLKSLNEYKSEENKIVHYVLNKLVEHCFVYGLRQRFMLIRSEFSNLCLEYMLTLSQAREQVLINRCQSSECSRTFIDKFYAKHLHSQVLKRAFLSWRQLTYLKRRYLQSTNRYVLKYIKSVAHKRFAALRHLVADSQASKRQVALNNKTLLDNRMLKDKILHFEGEINFRKREKQSGEKELLLLENEVDFMQTEIENSKDSIEEYNSMLEQLHAFRHRRKIESDAKIQKLKSIYQNLQSKKLKRVAKLAVLHRRLMNRQLRKTRKKRTKKRKKLKFKEKLTPSRQLVTFNESRPIPSYVSNLDIWRKLTRSTEFYVVKDSSLKRFVSDYEKTVQLSLMVEASNSESSCDTTSLMVCDDSPEIAYFKLQALFSKVITKRIKIKFSDKLSPKTFSPVDIALRYESLGNFAIAIKSKNMIIRPENEKPNLPNVENEGVPSPYHLIAECKAGNKQTQKQVLAIAFAVKDKYHNAVHEWLKKDTISQWIDKCKEISMEGIANRSSTLPNFPLKRQLLGYLNSSPVCHRRNELQPAFLNSEDEIATNNDSDSMEDADEMGNDIETKRHSMLEAIGTTAAFHPQGKVQQNVY